jgi:hypothetical protein
MPADPENQPASEPVGTVPTSGAYFEFCSGLFSIPAAIRYLPGVVILSLPAISAM